MRYTQPQSGVRIERSIFDPELLILGSVGTVNLGSGPKSISGTPSEYRVTDQGKSAYFNGASPGRMYTSVPAAANAAPTLTVLVAFTPDAAPASSAYSAVIFSEYMMIAWDHSNPSVAGTFSFRDTSGTWYNIPLRTTTAKVSTVICATKLYNAITVYQDGIFLGSQVVTVSGINDYWCFGERGNGNGWWWPGSIALAATSTRGITNDFAKSLSANPWQIFTDNKKPIFIGVGAAGGGLSITAELATASTSGYAATVNLQSVIPATLATAAASGLPATVTLGITLVYPVTDTAIGAWVSSTEGTLSSCINESTYNDADFISTNSVSTCEMVLAEAVFPGGANQVLKYRASSASASTLTVTLKQGATTIMTRTHVLTETLTEYADTLTSGEISLIVAGPVSVTLGCS